MPEDVTAGEHHRDVALSEMLEVAVEWMASSSNNCCPHRSEAEYQCCSGNCSPCIRTALEAEARKWKEAKSATDNQGPDIFRLHQGQPTQ